MLPDGAFPQATTPGAGLAKSMKPGGNAGAGRPPLSPAELPPRESAAAVAQLLER